MLSIGLLVASLRAAAARGLLISQLKLQLSMGKRLYFSGLRIRFQELVNSDQDKFLKIKELFRGIHNEIGDEELEAIENAEQLWRLLVSKDVISPDNVKELKDLALELEDEQLKRIVDDYESKTKGKA